MNTTTLQDEKSIDELARRIYVVEGRGGTKKFEQAREALLKENPQLREFARLRKGAKIKIPEIPGVSERKPVPEPAPRPRPRPEPQPRPDREHRERGGETAAEGKVPDAAEGLRASVAAFDAKLARSDEQVLASTERQMARLSDPRFRAAAKKNPRAAEVSKKLEASLDKRRKDLQAAAEERAKAFKEIEEDLGKLKLR
jgi:hypothetical protein